MIEKKDVEKLAALSRITIPEREIEKVRKDIGTILEYVGQINEANVSSSGSSGKFSGGHSEYSYNSGVKNVMRPDSEPHETGKFTETLLKSAPKTEKGYIKVKKILE